MLALKASRLERSEHLLPRPNEQFVCFVVDDVANTDGENSSASGLDCSGFWNATDLEASNSALNGLLGGDGRIQLVGSTLFARYR
jgi:hypothetical protein